MHERKSSNRLHHLLTSLTYACMLAFFITEVHAYHTEEQAPTYLTGHVLKKGEFRMGIDYTGYGLLHRVSVNTMLLGYLILPFTGDFAPNFNVRLGAISLKPIYFAIESGVTFVFLSEAREKRLSEAIGVPVSTEFFNIPVIIAISYHLNDALMCSMDVGYFFSNAGLRTSVSSSDSLGMLSGESLHVGLTLQYAFNRYVAATFKGRIVAWTPTSPFEFSIQVDESTRFSLSGEARLRSLKNAFQTLPGVAFSWKSVNLRLGLGYGHVFLPTLGIVSSYRGVVPDAEFYVRF